MNSKQMKRSGGPLERKTLPAARRQFVAGDGSSIRRRGVELNRVPSPLPSRLGVCWRPQHRRPPPSTGSIAGPRHPNSELNRAGRALLPAPSVTAMMGTHRDRSHPVSPLLLCARVCSPRRRTNSELDHSRRDEALPVSLIASTLGRYAGHCSWAPPALRLGLLGRGRWLARLTQKTFCARWLRNYSFSAR